jgi:anaerobic selenocysteine-containing dehydrogenase
VPNRGTGLTGGRGSDEAAAIATRVVMVGRVVKAGRAGHTGGMAANAETTQLSGTSDAPLKGSEPIDEQLHFRTCPLCEATCGLEISVRSGKVHRIRGDRDDVFSSGFICAKGSTIKDLDDDPDRIRTPMIRERSTNSVGVTTSTWREATWEEAFEAIDAGLSHVRATYGNDAVGLYFGNPTAHNLSGALYNGNFARALRSKNVFSASTVDQMPKQVSSGLMFGTVISIPVPDIDRTDYLLMLGANPYESNGSLMTAPDMPGRIEKLVARGGRLIVVDPRRTKTAEKGEHIAIRPGSDAAFLLALLHVIFVDGLVDLGRCDSLVNGLDEMCAIAEAQEFSPEATAAFTGIDAQVTRRVARELSAAKTAAVYGRIGTCTQEFGSIASWLVDVLNVVTGNLDREGGAMFTRPATGSPLTRGKPGVGRGVQFDRWKSRVRNAPEVFGEFPAAVIAEEIETPGDGQIRAMVTLAGNPVLSTPDSDRIDRALESLEFMVSVDLYLNETTKHADVLLPAARVLTRSHYDVSLYSLAIRNVANYSAPVFTLNDNERAEWETMIRLTAIAQGRGVDIDVEEFDTQLARDAVTKLTTIEGSGVTGRDPEELMAMLSESRGPDRLLDVQLRTGPYGDFFGTNPDGLTLAKLKANPHGIDFGPLEPSLPGSLRTPSGRVELAPQLLVDDVARLRDTMEKRRADSASGIANAKPFLLVGRRHVRSNNSWMHNLAVLVKGKPRCTMQMHPDDATAIGLIAGDLANVTSASGVASVVVETTDSIMRGVVSIPHGWGHDHPDARMRVAAEFAGVNANRLVPGDVLDLPSGNAVTNGVAVAISKSI